MRQCRIHQSELASHAITEHGQILLAAVGRDTGSAVREKIQNIIVKLEGMVFGTWYTPVNQVYVVAFFYQKLDQALAWPQVEDKGLTDQRHHHYERHTIDLISHRAVMMQFKSSPPVNSVLRSLCYRRVL